MICAIEWDSHPVGEARACGGDAMMRVAAFNPWVAIDSIWWRARNRSYV